LAPLLLHRAERASTNALVWVGAALLVVSGAIHLNLWDIAYRHVATLGPLFLLQAISAFVMALALAALRRGYLVVAALGLMIGTIVGFILVLTVGLFGFKLGFVSTEASITLAAECAAVVDLLVAALLIVREA
jgi:hypothetical protein